MYVIAFLILFPFAAAFLLRLIRSDTARKYIVFSCAGIIVAASIFFVVENEKFGNYIPTIFDFHTINMAMVAVEIILMAVIVYLSFKHKKYYVALLFMAQTAAMVWLDLAHPAHVASELYTDHLTSIMCLIIGVVGTLVCVYATSYMRNYHKHHSEYKDRSPYFFSILFVFLGAMFGLVFSSSLSWIYFFWEITSICSFLLIGYTRTKEAVTNAFRALWMNLLGGLAFAAAIIYSTLAFGITDLQPLIHEAMHTPALIIPVVLLAFAALTKSAQFPFTKWLLGAMVAPTPTSALLHSATMVKAGVYLLLRLSPAMTGNLAGTMVATIGGFTFLAASLLAISQSDGKKVLAYSTVANLGLVAACAGVGMHEGVWAGTLLMIFHAVSKSLMFLSVGAVESNMGSRNIEDMHGLIVKLPQLAFTMIIGIAGMFLAPFGMLISKWAALKAFVDSASILLIVFLVFGSAATLFYWTKWLGKLVSVIHNSERLPNTVNRSEWFSLISLAILMIMLCFTFPLISEAWINPLLFNMFDQPLPTIISEGNVHIMTIMLGAIVILPIAIRLLTFGKNKIVPSYMAGVNTGDDRRFVDSYGEEKPIYLANWYMTDYFGEQKLLTPSIILSAGALIVFMCVAMGGVLG